MWGCQDIEDRTVRSVITMAAMNEVFKGGLHGKQFLELLV